MTAHDRHVTGNHGTAHPDNGPELSAINCEERCDYTHDWSVWLASEDSWFCVDCLIDLVAEEFYTLAMDAVGWDGNTDEQEIIDRFDIEAVSDSSDEFTYFAINSHINGIDNFEITPAMIEKQTAKINRKV